MRRPPGEAGSDSPRTHRISKWVAGRSPTGTAVDFSSAPSIVVSAPTRHTTYSTVAVLIMIRYLGDCDPPDLSGPAASRELLENTFFCHLAIQRTRHVTWCRRQPLLKPRQCNQLQLLHSRLSHCDIIICICDEVGQHARGYADGEEIRRERDG